MSENSGYAEALMQLMLDAVDLLVDSLRVRYLARAITSAYLWTMRAFAPHPPLGWN